MGDDAFGVDHEYHRVGNAVPLRAPRELLVDQPERLDNLRLPVGKQGQGDFFPLGELGMDRDRVVGDDRDVVAESAEILKPFVPGDRLDLAPGSPANRS